MKEEEAEVKRKRTLLKNDKGRIRVARRKKRRKRGEGVNERKRRKGKVRRGRNIIMSCSSIFSLFLYQWVPN